MKTQEHPKFGLSKTGVKVYLRPEYHPDLKGTDLSHPDFVRKACETFGREPGSEVRGLPKICSENSEDAKTWHYFSPLLSMSKGKKAVWLKAFLTRSLGHGLDKGLTDTLFEAELMFWRGKKKEPFYCPPPALQYPETNTEVDLTVKLERAVVFVEAKHRSEISMNTTYCKGRDQIIRNIDVGTCYAWSRGLDFYFILVTSSESGKSVERLNHYKKNPRNITGKLPHRSDILAKANRISDSLGWTAWKKLGNIR